MKCPECGKDYTDRDVAADEGKIEPDITISAQHAYSLSELVKHYRQMINVRAKPNASLTMEYCDELLEDLND